MDQVTGLIFTKMCWVPDLLNAPVELLDLKCGFLQYQVV